MTADELMQAINALCQCYARAQVAHIVAGDAPTKEDYDHHKARAAYWDEQATTRYQAIEQSLTALLPEPVQVERFMPIRPMANGGIEIHAHDRQARRVAVLLTGEQALAVGAHLCAYAAVALDRIGVKVDSVLPPVKAAPPFVAPGRTPPPAPVLGGEASDPSAPRP